MKRGIRVAALRKCIALSVGLKRRIGADSPERAIGRRRPHRIIALVWPGRGRCRRQPLSEALVACCTPAFARRRAGMRRRRRIRHQRKRSDEAVAHWASDAARYAPRNQSAEKGGKSSAYHSRGGYWQASARLLSASYRGENGGSSSLHCLAGAFQHLG